MRVCGCERRLVSTTFVSLFNCDVLSFGVLEFWSFGVFLFFDNAALF